MVLYQVGLDVESRCYMRLVYPIYLDTPMMTGSLASLPGGLLEQADLESRTFDAKERSTDMRAKGAFSGFLSNFISGEAEGGLVRRVSEDLESHYKGTVRFPSASLFISLRDLLREKGNIIELDSAEKLSGLNI